MEDQNGELVVLHFATFDAAERALATVRNLAAEGFLTLEDARLISRSADYEITISGDRHKKGLTSAGGVLGLVAGGMLGLPILGLLAGAGVAANKQSQARIIELVAAAERNLAPGSAMVALLVSGMSDPEIVADRVEIHRDDILSVDIPPDLQAALDEARS